MKSIRVILFIITLASAKHNSSDIRSILESKVNFFEKIIAEIHNVTEGIFVTLKHRFTESPKNKLYLSMHNDLIGMARKNCELYIEMEKISQPPVDNTVIKNIFGVNDVIKEILFKEIYGVADLGSYDNVTSDFEDSVELADFVRNFHSKINDLKFDNLFKQPLNDTDGKKTDLSKEPLKVWRPKVILDNATRRLYRGKKAKVTHYPFVASIHIMGQLMCSGSIIGKDLILTAASCLQVIYNNKFFRENPQSLAVRVGSSYATRSGDLIPALEVHFYPGYNPQNLFHNLAIIRIGRIIRFSSHSRRVKKILLDKNEGILPNNVPSILVLGWGATDKTNMVGLLPKMSVSVLDVYQLDECKDVYSKYYVTNRHFCAGFVSKGGGACNKDAGGPGVVGGELAGVITFGPPTCGTVDAPTVFTRVGYYIDWIEQIMEMPRVVKAVRTTLKTRAPFLLPQVTPHVPTRGPVYPISLRNGTPRSSMETALLRQILNEVIFSKRDVIKELMYEAPDWGDDDFNDIFTPKPQKPASTGAGDDVLYGPMDEDDVFTTTEKKHLLEHPLINKSLIFIPEKYGIHETTPGELTLPPLPTSERPWMTTGMEGDEATPNPSQLRTKMDLDRNFNSESFSNNYESSGSEPNEAGSKEDDEEEITRNHKNMGRGALRQKFDYDNHEISNHKVKNTRPDEDENTDEEDYEDKTMDSDSLGGDITSRERYTKNDPKSLHIEIDSRDIEEEYGSDKMNQQSLKYLKLVSMMSENTTPVEYKKTNGKHENKEDTHKSLNKNGKIIFQLKTTPVENESIDEKLEGTDMYLPLPVTMHDEKYKNVARNLKNTKPIKSESAGEKQVSNNMNHESLGEDMYHRKETKKSTNNKYEILYDSDSSDAELVTKKNNHKPLEEASEEYKKNYANLKNKIIFESVNKNKGDENINVMEHQSVRQVPKENSNGNKVIFESDSYEEDEPKNMNQQSLREGNNIKSPDYNIQNKVLFESASNYVKHGTGNMKQEMLEENNNKEHNDDTRLKNKILSNEPQTNNDNPLDFEDTQQHEKIKKPRYDDSSPNAKHNKWNSRDTTDDYFKKFIRHNWNTEGDRFVSNKHSRERVDKNNYMANTHAGKTTLHVDHGIRMGRTMIVKEGMDKYEH